MFDAETIDSLISELSAITDNEDGRLAWRIANLVQAAAAGFTFVGLFVMDDKREFVVMKAGSGRAGEKLVQRVHRLSMFPQPRDEIGAAVYFNQVQVLDYSHSFSSPDIGASRWRLAFPLRVSDRAFGVLSVEGSESMSFQDENTLGFQKVADEVSRLLVKYHLN